MYNLSKNSVNFIDLKNATQKQMKKNCLFILVFVFHTFCPFAQVPSPELTKEVKFSEHNFIPFYNLKKKNNSTFFQGNKKKKKYFEGWYYKMVAEDGKSIISVIPGISLSTTGEEQHAFIQIINGLTAQTSYHSFPIESFSFSKKEFAIKIGENYFSKENLVLNINEDSTNISAKVAMSNITEYSKRKFVKRNIMGWYRRVPFMQCYHGVVSLTHDLNGQVIINGDAHNFNSGKGYIEKDWGASMPSSWIWMQCNNFQKSNSSFMISIADVPFLKKSFNGFLGFLYHNEKVYRFATYRNSKLKLIILNENTVKIQINNRKETIEIEAKRNNTGLLKAPVEGSMDRRIAESIDTEIRLKLFDKRGNLLYSDQSKIAGFELVGDIKSLIDKVN